MDFMWFDVIDWLTLLSNAIAAVTMIIVDVTVLVRSILNKKAGIFRDEEIFDGHSKLLEISKTCFRCGLVFHLVAYVLFYSRPMVAYTIAVVWGLLAAFTAINGIVSRVINGKETKNLLLFKKIKTFTFYSVIYFVLCFLLY